MCVLKWLIRSVFLKTLFTSGTLKLFLTRINIHMFFLRYPLCENSMLHVTLAALKWFIPNVRLKIPIKINYFCKSLITLAALMMFLPNMCLQMYSKITFFLKCLVTLVALIGANKNTIL